MSLFLSSSADLRARKELARLRIEMHRQQLIYHCQPLTQPLRRVLGLLQRRTNHAEHPGEKPTLMIVGVFLALFGRRLGMFGTIARIGLGLYPLLKLCLTRR